MPPAPALIRPAPARTDEVARLSWWQNGWRLGLAWVLGWVVVLTVYVVPWSVAAEVGDPPRAMTTLFVLDLLVGHIVIVLVAFRRRAPVAVAMVSMGLSAISAFGAPAAFLALLSLATRRRLVPLVWLGVVNLAAGAFNELVMLPVMMPPSMERQVTGLGFWWDALAYAVFMTLVYAIVVLIGWNVGSRRELVQSWRRQAETAMREQAARVSQAQLAERARIAREMHDVLAHRLSLVAMHAGVLAHRPDLPEDERREAAEVIREGTHQALEELREVLGVLRDDGENAGEDGRVEAPQPGLSGIPALVAEVTSSGQPVRLVAEEDLWRRSVSLPASTGRHTYRVVQEALTNARRHGRDGSATVTVDGAPGRGLHVVVSNPVRPVEEGTVADGGRGLAGMAERVQLAGGRFSAGVEVTDFVVRVELPWPEQEDGRG
ncbi:histidine kinase [Ornithinimicrobium humiphilum]|uniref:histidine kinase n=1 Tax=Ornithinimicrobium humiphilum TaxID=125288 RepID=A0A543KK86_9MICO|nr:histidine kinase [Ornithinimicrobium humiphilum]TQM95444.1 signal transduction histidine kinase [Ornithinimicrobium humiphilum]